MVLQRVRVSFRLLSIDFYNNFTVSLKSLLIHINMKERLKDFLKKADRFSEIVLCLLFTKIKRNTGRGAGGVGCK